MILLKNRASLSFLKTIIDCLQKNWRDNSVVFVFPTQVAADRWAETALSVCTINALAAERFIAWDRFKESSVKSRVANKQSVSSVVRSLFVHGLLAQNAREHFFETLIPKIFADDFAPFTRWISRLLPTLSLLKRTLQQKTDIPDTEDRDLLHLEKRYAHFLDENNLFEPAWEIPPFKPNGNTYIVFFPEVIEDFDEYELLLTQSPHVQIFYASSEKTAAQAVETFKNARQELRFLAHSILRDHLVDGVEFTDIAVSVPNISEIEPYLLRELRLHDIPVQFQAGKPLCEYAAGSLFSLAQTCVQSRFSLFALKQLLRQSVFPWRHPELNTQLVFFGEKNRCDCPADTIDVWLESFRSFPKEERLRNYYEGLIASLNELCAAKTFFAVRMAYFTFRSRFFDMELFKTKSDFFTVQTDAVMARCIEELSALIQIEHDFPQLAAVLSDAGGSNHCAFFTAILTQKQYLPREQGSGVHIFAYKAAACAPFERHYLINASQADASAVISPLNFLERDKRQKLGLTDKNISPHFFLLYQNCAQKAIFSVSEKTFSGYASPHGWFLSAKKAEPQKGENQTDLFSGADFEQERFWWAANFSADFPPYLFSIQKRGFLACSLRSKSSSNHGNKKDVTNSAALDAIRAKISEKKVRGSFFKISASDMNVYFECPLKWLYSRIFGVYDPKSADEMLSPLTVGSFYHAVISDVLSHIKNAPTDECRSVIARSVAQHAGGKELFGNLLPRLVMNSALEAAQETLERFFDFFAQTFAGSVVIETEKQYEIPFAANAVLTGKIDCVLFLNDGWCILDFKKNTLPSLAKYTDAQENGISDFQIPLYKRLFEETMHKSDAVTQASFVSIENAAKRVACVLGKNPVSTRSRSAYSDTETFSAVMTAFDTAAKQYYSAVDSLCFDFTAHNVPFKVCAACSFNTMCRTTYFISGEKSCRLML